VRVLVAAAAAVLLCGCEVYAVPSPITCPGELQGTFDFVADQIADPNACSFTQPPGDPASQVAQQILFVGSIAFEDTTAVPPGAALCKSVPHALPNMGVHDGTFIRVAQTFALSVAGCTCPSAAAAVAARCGCPPDSPSSNCSCPVVQDQVIEGNLLPIPGGYSGFQGSLTYYVTPPIDVAPENLCTCQKACIYAYDLAAKTVGAP
jgi:hypothetical protein